jgi:hypothetical protein
MEVVWMPSNVNWKSEIKDGGLMVWFPTSDLVAQHSDYFHWVNTGVAIGI